MSFWENNKGTFKSVGAATARGIGKGTKAVSKAGYNTYKKNEAKRKGLPPPGESGSPEPEGAAVRSEYRPPDKAALASLPPPVKRNVGAFEPPKLGEKSKYPAPAVQQNYQQPQAQNYQQPQQVFQQPQQGYQQNVQQPNAQQPQAYQQQNVQPQNYQPQGYQQQNYQQNAQQPLQSYQPQNVQQPQQAPNYQQPQQQPQYQPPQQPQAYTQPQQPTYGQNYQQPDQTQQPPAYVQAPGTGPVNSAPAPAERAIPPPPPRIPSNSAAQTVPQSAQQPSYQPSQQGQPYQPQPYQPQPYQPVAQQPVAQQPYEAGSGSQYSQPSADALSQTSTGNSKKKPSMFSPNVDLSQFAPPPLHKGRGEGSISPELSRTTTAAKSTVSTASQESSLSTAPETTQPGVIKQYQSTAPDPTKFAPPPPLRRGDQQPVAPQKKTQPKPPSLAPTASAGSQASIPAVTPGPPPALPSRNSAASVSSRPIKAPPPKPASKPSIGTHTSDSSTSTTSSLPSVTAPRPNSPPPPYAVEEQAQEPVPTPAAATPAGPNFAAEIARLRIGNPPNSSEAEPVVKKAPPPKPAKPGKPPKPAKPVIGAKPAVASKPETPVIVPTPAAKPAIASKPAITSKPAIAAKPAQPPQIITPGPASSISNQTSAPPPPLPRRESETPSIGSTNSSEPPRRLPPVNAVAPKLASSRTPPPENPQANAPSSPKPPPPPRNYQRKAQPLPTPQSAPVQPPSSGPPDLDLEMATGWYMATEQPMVLPKSLQGLNYSTSFMYSTQGGPGGMKKTSTRELNVRLKDLAKIKYSFTWINEDISSATVKIADFTPSPITHKVPSHADLVSNSQQFGGHVAAWALHHEGQQVGRGECWDLAKFALEKGCGNHAFVSTYYHHGFPILEVQGTPSGPSVARPQMDDIRKGDILQFTTAKFENKATGSYATAGDPDHTSVVIDKVGEKIHVAEQNVGGVKIVKRGEYELGNITQGSVVVYRPMPASWAE